MSEEELINQLNELREEIKNLEERKVEVRRRLNDLKKSKSEYLTTIRFSSL
jgi:chaperonin cofactor prefoldin